MKCFFLPSITFFIFYSCSNLKIISANIASKSSFAQNDKMFVNAYQEPHDTSFVNLADYSKNFIYDMRYATKNNFLKEQVYNCDECYLRYKTAKSLINANNDFIKKGFRIKLYDCYRPLDIQKKMWKIVSDPNYVADPAKGSIHNRGGAVDISLVDSNRKDVDMGTDFDFFGKEAAHQYTGFSDSINNNRLLIKSIMIQNNFKIFDSEWWHYNLVDSNKDKLSNFKWDCK